MHNKEIEKQVEKTFKQIADAILVGKSIQPAIKRAIAKGVKLGVKKEKIKAEELGEELLDMYEQYCSDGHSFMSAGEGASTVLERYGFAHFDEVGRIVNTTPNKEK